MVKVRIEALEMILEKDDDLTRIVHDYDTMGEIVIHGAHGTVTANLVMDGVDVPELIREVTFRYALRREQGAGERKAIAESRFGLRSPSGAGTRTSG
jgi:hypothetical protein